MSCAGCVVPRGQCAHTQLRGALQKGVVGGPAQAGGGTGSPLLTSPLASPAPAWEINHLIMASVPRTHARKGWPLHQHVPGKMCHSEARAVPTTDVQAGTGLGGESCGPCGQMVGREAQVRLFISSISGP